MDPITAFTDAQRKSWSSFMLFEHHTIPTAARLVDFAGIRAGHAVLDVACGTGVGAVTAARAGAVVKGLDLTPEFLEHARENASIAGVAIDFTEGNAESLPYGDATFDVVISQFGHMFAPRPALAVAEMLRVLRPGGTVAFSTWPPELYSGRMFALVARYLPPPPEGVAPTPLWGDPTVIRERLGDAVEALTFDRAVMEVPALSPAHALAAAERAAGPVKRVIAHLADEPTRLDAFRSEYIANASLYFGDNVLRQGFLMTRARKR